MKKYLQNIKPYFIIPLLCLLFCNHISFAQNIQLKIERLGLRIFSPTNGNEICGYFKSIGFEDDCGIPSLCIPKYPDPIINNKLVINAIDYQLPEFRGDDFLINFKLTQFSPTCCLTGWATEGWNFDNLVNCSLGSDLIEPTPPPTSFYALWYQNNNFSTSNNIDVQFAAYEDDNVLCGGNDAWCGGWNSLRILNDIPNSVNPCGEEFKDEITCSSDGSTRIWGLHYKVSWQWVVTIPDGIDLSKNACLGDNSLRINTTTIGTLVNTDFQWQFSEDATNWTNITGNLSSVNVDVSSYPVNTFVYVRKVKKGIPCTGFTTPIDQNSNICIIRIRPAPTAVPTATLVPNLNGICEATISNPIDQFNGALPFTWEYQTSYDGGFSWSASVNYIPTLTNPTTATVNGQIRFRANYDCGSSPWRTYAWSALYPQPVVATANTIYPQTANYTCISDSMYVIFNNNGYGGGGAAVEEYQYTTNGGSSWLTYVSGQKIPTPGGVGLSYGIRARRKASSSSYGCYSTAYTYYGYWTPYKYASSPTLLTKTPNVVSFCTGAYANVSATILSGNFGVPGQAANQYQYSIDDGANWQTYTSGANISTTNAVDAIIVRVRRVDGNPTVGAAGPCSTDWNEIAKWIIRNPICDFTATSSFCYNPNAPYVEIKALRPLPGVGTWSIVSGAGALSSTTSSLTNVTGFTIGSPTRIRWSVTESGCTKTKDTIITPTAISLVNLTNGNTCQTCPIRNGNSLRYFDNTGKLMANIADNVSPVSELSTTEICVGIDASVQTVTNNYGGLQPYLQRHFSIDPTLNTSSNVTLYFKATEFNNLKTACTSTPFAFTNVNELIVSKFPNGGNNTYTLPNTAGGIYILPTASGLDANGYYFLTIPVSTYSTFYIHSVNGLPAVLPVELTYFNATCEANTIKLNWQTASENNNYHFEIQRSENAIDFETILTIPTQNGNSNQLQNYVVYDNEPKNTHLYYRLKQVDNDGIFTYSKITNANCTFSSEKNTVVSVYPNPTNDLLNIAINATEIENAIIKIYDLNSTLVIQNEIKIEKGNNQFNITTSSLASGIYFIEISNNNKIVFRNKLVKQ